MNAIDQVSFQSAWGNRVEDEFAFESGKIKVFFIGVDDLIRNKRAVSRPRDLDDLEFLEKKSRMNL